MTITEIKIRLHPEKSSRVKAIADIYIKEGFMVHDVKIVQNPGHTLSLEFPLSPAGRPTFEPWKLEARAMIEKIVIGAYWRKLRAPHNAIESAGKPCYNTSTD